ncbi:MULTISPECIES: DUF2474 family protein [Shewanella]|uniref:DUF2474 family protein n=1 Tax=Shewanella mangrovisoli TaxID=2864211 RepID=A0ABV4VH89_9GAMM|nr:MULTISPECIES: DUF2474 family protein [Shewanella]MCL1119074.1 DUF2474 family protein [Shewanella seohaensis]MDH0447520.1 DUF2474 family protein [Shewanella sp. GD04112]QYJ72365.1 DUF2474 family protein [Shewanella sp. FJAT-51649]UXM81698.1 DUF2474 family protein [Shewanella seohaensis]
MTTQTSSLPKRLGWLLLIWCTSVSCLLLVSLCLKIILQGAGLTT